MNPKRTAQTLAAVLIASGIFMNTNACAQEAHADAVAAAGTVLLRIDLAGHLIHGTDGNYTGHLTDSTGCVYAWRP
jgi:hypothetical protein